MLNMIRELQARLTVAAVDDSGMSTVEYSIGTDCTHIRAPPSGRSCR